jgi:hypothetical protein
MKPMGRQKIRAPDILVQPHKRRRPLKKHKKKEEKSPKKKKKKRIRPSSYRLYQIDMENNLKRNYLSQKCRRYLYKKT